MKTTIEISDALLVRAKRHARKRGQTLRALVEDGLRHVLSEDTPRVGYVLPDHSVGKPYTDGASNPLERMSWPELREHIYGGR